jgi:hypothetical protein
MICRDGLDLGAKKKKNVKPLALSLLTYYRTMSKLCAELFLQILIINNFFFFFFFFFLQFISKNKYKFILDNLIAQ